MKKEVLTIAFMFILLSASLVYAEFQTGEINGIKTDYLSEDTVSGWINISFQDQNAGSLLEDNFENSISLVNLLKLNTGYEYSCEPNDCKISYTGSNPQESKTFTLNKNEVKILGLKFTGNDFEEVSSFFINVSSSAAQAENQQLFIDLLNDDEVEWQSYKSSGSFYDESFGCYTENEEQVFIHSQNYCEKINIPVAPNVEIGANVEKDSGENAVFVLSIDGNGVSDSCEIIVSDSGRVSCVLETKISQNQQYDICIKTKTPSDDNKFKINSETTNTCGYAGTESNERDFEIFAKPGRFAPVGEFSFDSEEAESSGSNSNLEGYLTEYVERFENDCSGDGCVIPIRFISEQDSQEITLSNASVFYISGGTPKEAVQIFDVEETEAVVNSEMQQLFINDAEFSVSGSDGESGTYTLNLGGQNILSEEITFESTSQIISLNSKTFIAAYPSKIVVKVSEKNNVSISKYEWDFGNNDTSTTTENEVTYTYPSIGTYDLIVKTTDENNISNSKTFTVNVKTPKEAIGFLLEEKINNLNEINSQILQFSQFHQSTVNNIIGISEIEDSISSIQKRNSTAQTDQDYVDIMEELIALDIPNSVFQSKSAPSLRFFSDEKYVNINVFKEITGEVIEEGTESDYAQAVVTWNIENMNSEMSFTEISAEYEESTEMILNIYELKIPEDNERDDSYFVIKDIENLDFADNYGERKTQGYTYISLGPEERVIEFSSTEDVNFEDLPAFIAPELRRLSIIDVEELSEAEKKSLSTGLLVLVILFIVFLGFIAYIILQEWYKKKYESYLFKSPNDLYNIISFIEVSKKRGIENNKIAKDLEKSGWNSEQITYVMKKYAGERTGMLEIPIYNVMKILKLKKKEEAPQSKNPPQSKGMPPAKPQINMNRKLPNKAEPKTQPKRSGIKRFFRRKPGT